MTDLGRFRELEFEISHRHSDGSMWRMEEQSAHHDPAQNDPERDWSRGRIFRCTRCQEAVTITPSDEDGLPADR